jgi:hypothetical protein
MNVTGIGRSLSDRILRPSLEAALLSIIVTTMFLLTMFPNLYQMALAGVDMVARSPHEQITYGLRLFDTFWPSALTLKLSAQY